MSIRFIRSGRTVKVACNNVRSGLRFARSERLSSVRTIGGDAAAAPVNPIRQKSLDTANLSDKKIQSIVDEISHLTLLETAGLISSLKARLNIPDLTIGNPAGAQGHGTATNSMVEEEETVAPTEEKKLFTLKLESFVDGSKPKVIKEIKTLLGLSLVDSKKFVEAAPKVIKESVSKEEAEKIMEAMKKSGAIVKLE